MSEIPPDVMRMVHCLGIALSDDQWLDDITIWASEGEVFIDFYMSLLIRKYMYTYSMFFLDRNKR